MSLNVFLTLCILGIDFMIYALFQWTYGDKRRAMARKIAAARSAAPSALSRPFIVASPESVLVPPRRPQGPREGPNQDSPQPNKQRAVYGHRLA